MIKLDIKLFSGPLVYIAYHNNKCYYVGSSRYGCARVLNRGHHVLWDFYEEDIDNKELFIIPCKTESEASRVELLLIQELNPLSNHAEKPRIPEGFALNIPPNPPSKPRIPYPTLKERIEKYEQNKEKSKENKKIRNQEYDSYRKQMRAKRKLKKLLSPGLYSKALLLRDPEE